MIRALLLVGALAGAAPAWAPAWAQVTGEIVQFGEIATRRVPVTDPRGQGTGLAPVQSMVSLEYLDASDHVEAALCRTFGVTVRIAGPDGVVPRRLQVRVRHPLMTREDGATSTEDAFPTFVDGGMSNVGFTFDHRWEMVPGDWEIAFYFKGALLAAKRFVVAAPGAGHPDTVCEAVSS